MPDQGRRKRADMTIRRAGGLADYVKVVDGIRVFELAPVAIREDVLTGLKGDRKSPYRELHDLIDNPPRLKGQATQHMDGRRVPVVLGTVRDRRGRTRAGIPVVLEAEDGRQLDLTRTTAQGAFALRFPAPGDGGHHGDGHPSATGTVRTLIGGGEVDGLGVTVPEGAQHEVVTVVVEDLAESVVDLTEVVEGATGGEVDGAVSEVGASGGNLLEAALGDDPFDVLPVDMTPELCDAVGQLFGPGIDTILTNPAKANDFRSRRTRLIKHVTVPRVGPARPGDAAPPRYLVTLRQEWRFLGYTLGEVADIDPLAPGSLIQTTTNLVSQTTERVSSAVQDTQRHVRSVLESTLSRLSSVDTLVDIAHRTRADTSTSVTTSTTGGVGPKDQTGAIIGGIVGGILGGPLGGLIGAGIGSGGAEASLRNNVTTDVSASLDTRTIARTGVNTSLEVNSLTREAQSVLNRAISEVSSAVRTLRETTNQVADQVSPLLSRVTNLLKWRLYENYAVCSHVEDVVELKDYLIFGASEDDRPLFNDEDIVEYRRFFEPSLLEPRLAPHFDHLRASIARATAAGLPVTAVRITVRCSTNGISGGVLEARIGSGADAASTTIRIPPGATVGSGILYLPEAAAVDDLGDVDLSLTVEPGTVTTTSTTPGPFGIPVPTVNTGPDPGARVAVTSVSLAFHPGRGRVQRRDLGSQLVATAASPTSSHSVTMAIPPVEHFPEHDPLVIHINRNATYYFSLLLEAAKDNPALRDDIRQLAGAQIDGEGLLSSDSALWRLPIAGFEGNRILVVRDLDDSDEYGQQLLADPGAGTLVQIAAPGAYGEALEGLLALTDAIGELHPGLLPVPAPAMPPLALVDLAGRTLQVVDGATEGSVTDLTDDVVPT